jgi:hypothetical protein
MSPWRSRTVAARSGDTTVDLAFRLAYQLAKNGDLQQLRKVAADLE